MWAVCCNKCVGLVLLAGCNVANFKRVKPDISGLYQSAGSFHATKEKGNHRELNTDPINR